MKEKSRTVGRPPYRLTCSWINRVRGSSLSTLQWHLGLGQMEHWEQDCQWETIHVDPGWHELRCGVCEAPVSRKVLAVSASSQVRQVWGEDLIPQGALLDNHIPAPAGSWILNVADHSGVASKEGFTRFGQDGLHMNLRCQNGHPVGFETNHGLAPVFARYPKGSVYCAYHPLRLRVPLIAHTCTNFQDARWSTLGVAWDESFSRQNRSHPRRDWHRWALVRDVGPFRLLAWTEGEPGTPFSFCQEMDLVAREAPAWTLHTGRSSPDAGTLRAWHELACRDHPRIWALDPTHALHPDLTCTNPWDQRGLEIPSTFKVRLAGHVDQFTWTDERQARVDTRHTAGWGRSDIVGVFDGWTESGTLLKTRWTSTVLRLPEHALTTIPVHYFQDPEETSPPPLQSGTWVRASGILLCAFDCEDPTP